ncbi:guanitoxin biosynthesis MBL fold metallo-hydrolase GntH [Motilimonas eburnea]|uniref:guanitoxin biosynthesis MBL fold metallo-hydrolase GntH n=1 Tax=Motilimonas eburnea TaxID=1737488 RepID=UPI001E6500CC|nr:guanitoxin biosynthesis MBL fold metallo-hydrolase GntH [Motilimonas eburnea]MCE2572887.1 MBL fold metallo-hydrolase [Motilimonas eburnea]
MKLISKTIKTALLSALSISTVAIAAAPPASTPSTEMEVKAALFGGVPGGRWKEGLLFEGIRPQPWLQSAANWFPGTEDVQPNEMRITFMGTSPMIRPGQMNTSIFVELGNGDNFVFDIGEGSVANYVAARVALNQINNIFLTHLHVDHFGALPYVYMFGGWAGRWHEPLRIHGPSGRKPEFGTKAMVEGMKQMLAWHRQAFSVFPVGQGHDVAVTEFDFRDNGGTVYEKNNVKVIHWQRSHAMDGASAYRLDWKINDTESLCFVWTGDGRPSELDKKYAKGCDVYVTELQQEVVEINSGVQGVPPFLARYTIDTHHTPGYAAGYVANQIKPRIFMTTHMTFDPWLNEESVAEVREHWKGPYHFGAPDGIVVNVTPDSIWVRDGILPDYPNSRAPQQDFSSGQLVVPVPQFKREDLQEPFIREQQVDPDKYYPSGYKPELLEDWPVKKDLVVPYENLPENLKQSMGGHWELKNKNQKALDEMNNK